MSADAGAPSDDEGTRVLQFPVTFKPDTKDDAPDMRPADTIHDDRCLHRRTIFDKRARTVTCRSCGVNVDPFEALADVVSWIHSNEWRYQEMQSAARVARLGNDVHLIRVVQGKNSLLIGRCYVSGYHNTSKAIPTEQIALGDYVSQNRLYRVRRDEEGWKVKFYDPAHGLKDIKTIARATLAQSRAAVRKHWLWLNNNAHAAGLK